MNLIDRAVDFFQDLQDEICAGLEALEGKARFREDKWQRAGGGGGRTRVIEGGDVFEKGGVNFSDVHGELRPDFARSLPGEGLSFRATGISLVIHPRNPFVPTVHANFRRLERGGVGWFGGGADLTPYYLFDEDAVHFHRTLKGACDGFEPGLYPRWKAWCDRYFFIAHRQEPRGVGGLFFDYLGVGAEARSGDAPPPPAAPAAIEGDAERLFAFIQAVGRAFLPAYVPIVQRRKDTPFEASHRDWQLHRRGRYVEFNLVYDRGTVFGLRTDGRVESILMSLPPHVTWGYAVEPAPGSPEARTVDAIRARRDWATEGASR